MSHIKNLLLLLVITVSLTACGVSIPDEAAFLDEVAKLIETSMEVNTLYFGEGLPMDTGGRSIDEILAEAEDEEAAALIYLPVTEDAAYQHEEDIRDLAASAYSASYCTFLNQLAFEGLADGGEIAYYARYITDFDLGLTINLQSVSEAIDLNRTYDLETLKIVRSQNGFWLGAQDYVVVSVDAYDDGAFAEVKELKVVRDEAGWRLDWPTY